VKHVAVTSNRWVSENTGGTADAQISLMFLPVMVPVLSSKEDEKLASIESGFKLAWISTRAAELIRLPAISPKTNFGSFGRFLACVKIVY
jgi:hypothetical protein